jgi:nucleoside-diphosphate-sugar epimerase
MSGTIATICGDGNQSRDFTYVDDVVDANLAALRSSASGVALNVAGGQSHSLLELVQALSSISGRPLMTTFGPARKGDIRHSRADISLANAHIGYCPRVSFMDGLRRAFDGYRSA